MERCYTRRWPARPARRFDSRADIERLPAGRLRNCVVLTNQIRGLADVLADRGAVAVISDRPVPNNPRALAWTKFGWGAVPMHHATARLVGFVLSQRQGEALRRQAQRLGTLELVLKADIRKYVGHHDVVSGIVRGQRIHRTKCGLLPTAPSRVRPTTLRASPLRWR